MIAELVADLPEVYQPIYAHPELSVAASRRCDDRLALIVRAHDALRELLGRPLKVLDLGCAQGFFSFSLAEHGAMVHGVDYEPRNVAVCTALAEEHPQFTIDFEIGRIEDVIERLEQDQYDLVLGLSVFHHIVQEKGVDAVGQLLDRVAACCGTAIVEMALQEEPLYWGPAQPKDPRTLLESIAFIHELGRHPTHLASIPRPLYVASNRYWLLDAQAGHFDTWSENPHVLANGVYQGSRRYFFSADHIVKLLKLDHPLGEGNKAEWKRETDFLTSPPPDFATPKCLVAGTNETRCWSVVERLPGRLLLDRLREGSVIDDRRILLDVLEQLTALEAAGLYHNDVRTWNVLVTDDSQARLIDYGSIGAVAQDCVWPKNIFLAFLIFIREVSTGTVDDPELLRTASISPYRLPPPYRAWGNSFWQRPLSEWSFHLMLTTLSNDDTRVQDMTQLPIEGWIKAIEEAVDIQNRQSLHLRRRIDGDQQTHSRTLQTLSEALARERDLLEQRAFKAEALESEIRTSLQQQQARVAELEADRSHSLQLAQTAQTRALQAEAQAADTQAQLQRQQAQGLQQSQAAEMRIAALHAQLQQQQTQGVELEADLERRLQQAQIAETTALKSQARLLEMQAQLEQQQAHIAELGASHSQRLQQSQMLELERNALRASWSWRVTQPLRWGASLIMRDKAGHVSDEPATNGSAVSAVRLPLTNAMRVVLSNPALAYRINQQILRYPALHQRLRGAAQRAGLMPGRSVGVIAQGTDERLEHAERLERPDRSSLTPYAREILDTFERVLREHPKDHV